MNIYNEAIQEKDIKNNKIWFIEQWKIRIITIKLLFTIKKLVSAIFFLRKFKNKSYTVNLVCCLGNKKKKDNKIIICDLPTKTRGAHKKLKYDNSET